MIARNLADNLVNMAQKYPVISVTGPRQSGKTTLIKNLFKDYLYANLEFPDTFDFAKKDPRGFFAQSKNIILDEVQHVPELLSYIQGYVDEDNSRRFIISGSQNLLISKKVSQSLAGRVFIANLLPLSLKELKASNLMEPDLFSQLYKGFYPRIYNENLDPSVWYKNYIQTYLERDVRDIKSVEDLTTFRQFMALLAGRTGQILNMNSLASDTGVTLPTIKSWISILEASYIIKLLPPYHANWNKRIVKAPKVHFLDTGLVCALLKINKSSELATHPLIGSIFESFVFSEYVKRKANFDLLGELYFWKDKTGREVDILVDEGLQTEAIEVKLGQTVSQEFFTNLEYYKKLSKTPVNTTIVYGGQGSYYRNDHKLVGWREI